MVLASIGLFAVAALAGLYMITKVFRGQLPPWGAAIFHGLFAATGLVILLYSLLSAQPTLVAIAAVLLVVAALGGFVMIGFHLQRKVPPKALAGIHALAAVAGVGLLLVSALNFA